MKTEQQQVVMSDLDKFSMCVDSTEKDGRISIKCKLGLWSVDAGDSDRVYIDAFHYWRQYKADGEYHSLIGGDDPKTALMKSIKPLGKRGRFDD